jgi:hypothetical protein
VRFNGGATKSAGDSEGLDPKIKASRRTRWCWGQTDASEGTIRRPLLAGSVIVSVRLSAVWRWGSLRFTARRLAIGVPAASVPLAPDLGQW